MPYAENFFGTLPSSGLMEMCFCIIGNWMWHNQILSSWFESAKHFSGDFYTIGFVMYEVFELQNEDGNVIINHQNDIMLLGKIFCI
jgi:hypothetical protein